MQINKITITGADENTSLDDLVDLCNKFPQLEIGLLYTATPEGRNRYPSLDWLNSAASRLSGRCAIHICGGGARKQLLAGELHSLTQHAPRVQVNGVVRTEEAIQLASMVNVLITQHNASNDHLVNVPISNHSLLVDGSGGRGITPEEWYRPGYGSPISKPVGFAGGLGPDNLMGQLQKINLVACSDSWIDMEGKLRTDDWFDLALAKAAVEKFDEM